MAHSGGQSSQPAVQASPEHSEEQPMVRPFKQLLAEDKLVRVFSMARFIHPVVIDMFGLAGGYDGFWLDQEHGGLSYEQICLGAVCGRANDFDTFVRMAPTN